MSKKNLGKSNEIEQEIVDVNYQIEEADTETSPKAGNKRETKSGLDEDTTKKELFNELEQVYKQLENKDEQYNKIHKRYLRALADYENLEKRTRTERARIVKQANERLLLKLVELADSFEKAEAILSIKDPGISGSVIEGFQAVHQQFKSILKNEEVVKIPAIGEMFDPNFHEVVFVKPDPNTEDDIILEEVQIGYLLNSKVLRPAKVVVAKTKTEGEK